MRVKKTFNEPDEGRCYEFLYDSTDVSSHRHARMHFLLANFLYNAHLHTQIYRFWMPTKHPTLKDIERTTDVNWLNDTPHFTLYCTTYNMQAWQRYGNSDCPSTVTDVLCRNCWTDQAGYWDRNNSRPVLFIKLVQIAPKIRVLPHNLTPTSTQFHPASC